MGDLQVLHQEPRHKVDNFVDEMLWRTQQVISDLGPKFEQLLRDMISQFHQFKAAHYLITLNDVKFDWIRWTKDGQLAIEFSADPHTPAAQEVSRHKVIDAFVDEVVGRTVPEELREEFAQFARGMVMQFAMLKKHHPIDLTQVTFDAPYWATERVLVTKMLYQGKPFLPRDVGL